jgi:hypothetical protein
VSAYQKVGSFRVVNGAKQGGNVASYFCLPNGRVLHTIPGPVNAETLLREARWVVELQKMAVTDTVRNQSQYALFIRKAHLERLQAEYNPQTATARWNVGGCGGGGGGGWQVGWNATGYRNLSRQGQAHMLLAQRPLPFLSQVYRTVFEQILHQKISTLPVDKVGA